MAKDSSGGKSGRGGEKGSSGGGGGCRKESMEIEKEQSIPEYQQKTIIVHERVAFGEKVSILEHRSGAGSHRSGMLTEYAQESVAASKVQQGRRPNAVRPRRNINPDPRPSEY
jgi:hypothetical protein